MSDSTQEVQKLLWTLIKRIRSDMEEELVKHKAGITLLQYSVLKHIAKEHRTLQEISATLLMRPPSLVPSIDTLERLKLLERLPDVSDRRKIQLRTTKRGKNLLKRIPFTGGAQCLKQGLRQLGTNKTLRLTRLLKELSEVL